jgi:hypothetical protein
VSTGNISTLFFAESIHCFTKVQLGSALFISSLSERIFVCANVANEEKVKDVMSKSFVIMKCYSKIATNEKGLAFVGELAFRLPITEAQ